jgi:hypothetical protein
MTATRTCKEAPLSCGLIRFFCSAIGSVPTYSEVPLSLWLKWAVLADLFLSTLFQYLCALDCLVLGKIVLFSSVTQMD